MIDEKKLIEERPEYLNPNRLGHEEYNKGWNACNDMWFKLIKAQPKVGEWIPCSSGKLPQRQDSENFNLEMYLVRLKDNRIRLGYRDEKGTWRNEHWNKLNVIEWKPIDTEPYKEEVQNDL